MRKPAEPPNPCRPAGGCASGPGVDPAVAAPGASAIAGDGAAGSRRLDAVLFDFHGTLAQVEDPITWVRAAAADCGVALERGAATVLADRLVTAGRAGGPPPYRVPPHLIDVWAERDLYERAHRAAYVGLAATVSTSIDGLPEALYERVMKPDGWLAYADSADAMRAVKAAGLAVAVVSNIGFDIRPIMESLGLAALVDAYCLSYEVGRVKPDPAIFEHACATLRVDPQRALMVGDTVSDAGAVAIGCPAYLVCAAGPGCSNGLAAVAVLAGATNRPAGPSALGG